MVIFMRITVVLYTGAYSSASLNINAANSFRGPEIGCIRINSAGNEC
jgi:hypothetical protein